MWRQLAEMALLYVRHGVGPGYYQMAGFFRRDLTWKDKTLQLSATQYRRRVNALNPLIYRKISQHKIPEKAVLSLFSIPTPRFLGRLQARSGRDHAGRPLQSAADLEALVRRHGLSKLVFKQPEGHGGKGVQIARVEHAQPMLCGAINAGQLAPLVEYCDDTLCLHEGEEWLVEEHFTQHPAVAAINPGSVNTVRIWVVARGDGMQVVLAYLRIGRGHMFVDNASSGGIVAPIDMATGRLRPAQDAHAQRQLYARHPDHGAAIDGVLLPCWPEVQDLAKRALAAFPLLRFAGLDVAIGPDGPVVLELNVSPDREAAAFTGCATAEALPST
ncbi:MAG: hypothetical protein KF720_07155 [Rubrivivax sp.]|nr:hypothetical protein [Rubrivivax sp.]